ncbi:hypothetical protein HOG17_00880 [Candidatus Peregrinibacteria bacterium]|nr:hypothetical protein [Candidatus Peregrinibacteria bacterium]MBT4148593.1 hypothetical protein [Candidatus Peregrinibacteria bacterium]MBT4456131.1 hypothetical protein [Candidatus Peregrinibacteria bacterium]
MKDILKSVNWNQWAITALLTLFAFAIINGIWQGKKNTDAYVDDVIAEADEVLALTPPILTSPPVTCVPFCEGKECGDDGCGGNACGECAENEECIEGWCEDEEALIQSPCIPSCKFKECGPDGCGGFCGPNDCDWKHGAACIDGECCMPASKLPTIRLNDRTPFYWSIRILFFFIPETFVEKGWRIPTLNISLPPPPKRGMAHGGPWVPDTVDFSPEEKAVYMEQIRADPFWNSPLNSIW